VENGSSVAISGVALNEELIAAFMKNLQSSGSFTNVELQVTEQTDASGVKAKRFDLGMQIKS
jgi:type IV pilus assembly protein PilN